MHLHHGIGLVRREAVRTEDVYKIYAENFSGPERLKMIQEEEQDIVSSVIGG